MTIFAQSYVYLCDGCDKPMQEARVANNPDLLGLTCRTVACPKVNLKRFVQLQVAEEVDRRDSGMPG